MNINMEWIDKENLKEENIELHSLRGANSDRPVRHMTNSETQSLPQELVLTPGTKRTTVSNIAYSRL